ncbi:MAG: hypothetical protein IJU98_02060 [Synergistaceae bacterium]|nr:hypothetical protein [Synergistaceae bacterium]
MGLLKGELWLTLDILLGLAVGELILRLGLADRLLRRLTPFLRRHGVEPVVGLALTLSLGSSKAGAALLAGALDRGEIDRRTALWGTLMLPLPAYLRRWPATFALAASMAGLAGGLFALFLLLRSSARFVVAFLILRHGSGARPLPEPEDVKPASRSRSGRLWRKLLRTLPLAWLLFALTYALVPWADAFFKRWVLGGDFLPLAGWTVAAGSLAHVSAALALAGGALAAGELSTAQAVFALILGSALGIVTRVLRQNAGYYFGLFPPDLARRMLFWNLATILPFVLLSLALATVPLL